MEGKTWLVLLCTVLLLLIPLGFSRRLENQIGAGVFHSRHFTITYENIPRLAVRYLVEGMEEAYQRLVIQHRFRDGQHTWNWKESEPLAKTFQIYCYRSMAVHEYFHSIQLLGYTLKLADRFLSEGTAMWAMREVFPQHIECYIRLLLPWLIGGTDVSSLKLLYPGHQAGLFWNFISDHYGGAQLIRSLFEHADIRLGVGWPKALEQLTGKSFLDLWAEFAVALAARQVPDAKWLYYHAEQGIPYVPVPVFVGEWTGQSITIEHGNWENPYPQICAGVHRGACLSPSNAKPFSLMVRHPYGIHFLRIIPKSAEPLTLQFAGDPETDFRVFVVAKTSAGAYESFPLVRECFIPDPLAYMLFQVVVTRGNNGSGQYQLALRELQINEYPPCR